MPESVMSSIINFIMGNIWFFVLLGIIIFVAVYFIRRRKEDKFKRLSVAKEIKKELDFLYKIFYNPANKELSSGLVRKAFVLGYLDVYWDKNTSLINNLKANNQLKKYVKSHPEIKQKDGTFKKDYEEMYLFKTCGLSAFSKIKARFGLGTTYIIIPKRLVKENKDEININPMVQPSTFYKIVIYEKSARDWLENNAYKMTRQEELEELVNYVPKSAYLETSNAGIVSRLREKAEIEKEKYRGQVESAQS